MPKQPISDQTRLRIAVQKSGRLAEPSLALLGKCGIRFEKSKNQLFCQSKNFPGSLRPWHCRHEHL
jgi:ATP phosphoribosyltransferase